MYIYVCMYSFDKRTVCYGIDDPFSSMIYLFNMVIFHITVCRFTGC